MTEHTVAFDGYHLRVHEVGQGPTVVFGHSLTFDSSMWAAQIEALSTRYRLLLVDLHGHGGSTAPNRVFTLEEMADDVVTAVQSLGAERFGYVGHSMGGMVGMRLALAHPTRVASLALLNTSPHEQLEPMRSLFHQVNEDSRGKPSGKTTVDFVLGLMFSDGFRKAEPDRVAPFEKILYEPPDPEGVYWTARAVIWRSDVLEQLAGLAVPTLVVSADGDTSIPPGDGEEMGRTIPGATFLNLAGAGHLTPVERADDLTGALAAHLDHTLEPS